MKLSLLTFMNKFSESYTERYDNYQFSFDIPDKEKFDPEIASVDVKLKTMNGDEYYGSFTTLHFLEYMFDKNKRTGECANGSYFCMPRMIVVERIDEEIIKSTIDDLVYNNEFEEYFTKMD